MQSADKEITVFSKDGKLFQIGILSTNIYRVFIQRC